MKTELIKSFLKNIVFTIKSIIIIFFIIKAIIYFGTFQSYENIYVFYAAICLFYFGIINVTLLLIVSFILLSITNNPIIYTKAYSKSYPDNIAYIIIQMFFSIIVIINSFCTESEYINKILLYISSSIIILLNLVAIFIIKKMFYIMKQNSKNS